jgi:hypothetical protein
MDYMHTPLLALSLLLSDKEQWKLCSDLVHWVPCSVPPQANPSLHWHHAIRGPRKDSLASQTPSLEVEQVPESAVVVEHTYASVEVLTLLAALALALARVLALP